MDTCRMAAELQNELRESCFAIPPCNFFEKDLGDSLVAYSALDDLDDPFVKYHR